MNWFERLLDKLIGAPDETPKPKPVTKPKTEEEREELIEEIFNKRPSGGTVDTPD